MTRSRQAMLEAGVRLYGCRSSDLLKGLTTGMVADQAGFHRQTFYRYWDTQADYVQDLVAWLMNPRQGPGRNAAGAAGVPRGVPGDIEAFVRDMTDHDLPRWRSDDLVRMRISLLMMGVLRDPSTRDHTSTYHAAAMHGLAAAYEDLLAAWGLELVDGVSSREVARAIAIQLVGFAILAEWADDEPPVAVSFERSTVGLLRAWSRSRGNGTQARIGMTGVAAGRPEAAAAVVPAPDTRDQLLAAGTRLYLGRAVDLLSGLSAGMVAREAGVHRQTFYRHWDSQTEYIQDLLGWLFAPSEGPRATRPDDMRHRRLPARSIESFVRDLIQYDLTRLVQDDYARMRLGLVMTGGLGETVEQLARQYYNESRALLAVSIERLLGECELEPVDGQSAATLASVIHAQLLGALLVFDTTPDDEPSLAVVIERMMLTALGALTRAGSSVSGCAGVGTGRADR